VLQINSGAAAQHAVSAWSRFAQVLISWGPPGLFCLSILDSAGLPVVGGVDALLVAIATRHPAKAYIAAALAVAGSLVGNLILYVIARMGGEVLLMKHISSRRGARLHLWFQRYGLATVFIPAVSPLPLPMKIPVVCAGALEVRVSYFIAVVLAARGIRYFALAYLAQHYGHSTFQFLLSHGVVVAIVAVSAAAIVAVGLRIYQRHKAAEGEPE
jgi:membrane protein YqaA with SNARE-associated domain